MKIWRFLLWCLPFGLLAIPAIAMHFTSEVNWGPEDFLTIGVLLIALTAIADFVLTRPLSVLQKLVWMAVALTVFLLIWAELSVGILP